MTIYIYSSEQCHKCHALAAWLGEQKIPFEEIKDIGAADITEFRLNGIYTFELPIMRMGGMWFLPPDLFHGDGSLDTERLKKIFWIE